MKRLIIYILPFVLLALAPSPSAKAQADAAALAPLLEKWEILQMGKFAEQSRNMIENLNTTIENLQNVKNTYSTVSKAYKLSTALFTGMEDIYEVYYEMDALYSRCIGAYNYVSRHLANGDISLNDASYILSTIEYVDVYGRKTVQDVVDLLNNEDLPVEFKLKKFKDDWATLKGMGRMVSKKLSDTQEKIESDQELDALSQLVWSAYAGGTNTYGTLSQQKAQKDIDAVVNKQDQKQKNGVTIEKGINKTQIESTTKGISGLGTSILNIVSIIIFVLFIIMAIPAYYRRNQGHQQSSDAIIKLFRGTVIIIFVIQVFGRILFSLDL